MQWELVKRFFLVGLLAGMVALFFAACFDSDDDDPVPATSTTISDDTTYSKGLEIVAGNSLIIDDSEDDGDTTINIIGDFDCAGKIDVRDVDTTIRINVTGNANLSCSIEFPTTGTGDSQAVMVVDGLINISDGFNPFIYGSVIIVDDEALLKTPAEYAADALVDEGLPVIMKPVDDQAAAAAAAGFPRRTDTRVRIMARGCTAGAHTISGSWVPLPAIQNLDQGASQDPIVFSVWTECDLNVDNFEIDPPIWADPPPTDGEGDDPADAGGADGRKGMTLNARTNGKMNFSGGSVLTLMDGGAGQAATHTGDPASATGGKGGKSGDMKIQAGGGFNFAEGATLTINPGKGGDGGDATATGTAGVAGCPGTKGANATATGGDGGENKKKLTIRGIDDPASKVIVNGIEGGIGGKGTATGGKGGKGNDGDTCNGGAGGNATGSGGNGGDASYSGNNAISPDVFAGDGGDASAEAGAGGNGGNNEPNKGGNGGNGGNSDADAGKKGTETGGNPMGQADDGAPTTVVGGVGGDCGKCDGVGGTGGNWNEKVNGVSQANDKFDDGSSDCECEVALCGNDFIDAGEECDGSALGGKSCSDFGFDTGALECTSGCMYDTSGCGYIPVDPICGDDTVNQESEACDGSDLNGKDCESQGYDSGTLACSECQFDTSGCEQAAETCGDGVVNDSPNEVCDGNALGGEDCESQGYASGTLACDGECQYDTSGCTAAIANVDSSCAGVTHGAGSSTLLFQLVFLNALSNSNAILHVTGQGIDTQLAAVLNASLVATLSTVINQFGVYNWTLLSLTPSGGIPYSLSGTTTGSINVQAPNQSCP